MAALRLVYLCGAESGLGLAMEIKCFKFVYSREGKHGRPGSTKVFEQYKSESWDVRLHCVQLPALWYSHPITITIIHS